MRRSGLLALLMPLLSAIAGAAELPPGPDGSVVVPLKLVPTNRPGAYQMVQLKDGKGELATPGGSLKVEFRGDKLWMDSNADGKITSADASIKATPSTDNGSNTISAGMKIAGREVKVPFNVMQAQKEYAYMALSAALEGQINGVQIRLIPGNANGEVGGGITYQYMQVAKDGGFESARMQGFSRTADIGGKLYYLAAADGGWSLKMTPYEGPVARVAIKIAPPANACELTLISADKSNTAYLSAAEVGICIPGEYRISSVHLSKGENGSHICVGGQQGEKDGSITIPAGDSDIALGGPYELTFGATYADRTLTISEVAAIGASRIRYNPPAGNTDGQLFAAYLRKGGQEQEIAKMAYG